MTQATSHIIFSGAFDIGETISLAQQATVAAAQELSGTQALFVGDIGLADDIC